MSITMQPTPTSHLRFGIGSVDVTPPVGIYHPMWGAARHHRATGVHRPLYGDVMLFAPLHDDAGSWAQVQLDFVGLAAADHAAVRATVADALGLAPSQVVVSFSHSHAAGLFSPDRVHLPGGEMIIPYLAEVRAKLADAAATARTNLAECYLTYAIGRCTLAANRDYFDDDRGIYACGFNPGAPADDTLLVVRAASPTGELRALVVNYACHPTTLAWDNTLISPDYIGALRAEVQAVAGVPCVFTQGASGDLGPRHGFVGDPKVADANGRQVAFAALAALASMDPPAHDFAYAGPVVSGATLGTWLPVAFTEERRAAVTPFAGGEFSVELPQKPRPDPAQLEQELAVFLAQQAEADRAGDAIAARDFGARAERARRWLGRLKNLPAGPTYPFHFSVRRMGDGFWVSVGGEPYNLLQRELRSRFPAYPMVVTELASDLSVAYLLPRERYGVGRYQEEPSILAPGCLEQLIDAVSAQLRALGAG